MAKLIRKHAVHTWGRENVQSQWSLVLQGIEYQASLKQYYLRPDLLSQGSSLFHGEASAIACCLCRNGICRTRDSEPPRELPAPRAMFPIHDIPLEAALFMFSLKETTLRITGLSTHAAAATPAVATPAVGSTFRRISGLAGTAARALLAGRAIYTLQLVRRLRQVLSGDTPKFEPRVAQTKRLALQEMDA